MIPNRMFDTFQSRIDFSYGLDVEIRPKLTPGAGPQVQYSTALWLHGHVLHQPVAGTGRPGAAPAMLSSSLLLIAARAPCDVFDPWVHWERGQVGI